MTTVLFDAHHLGRRQTGNETYVRELLRAFRMRDEPHVIAAVEDGHQSSDLLSPPLETRRVPAHGVGRLASLALLARRLHPDVVHAMYFLPPLTGRPSVVTVHDISFELWPQLFSRAALVRDRLLVRRSARAATEVITVSETSRRDLIGRYGLHPDRVHAIPNGVADQFRPLEGEVREPYDGDRPLRILAVGTLQPRKNLLRLLEAVRILSAQVRVSLRVVGPDGYQGETIRALLGQAAAVQVVGYVTPAALVEEYRRADVFVYPSLYEGFGLPVLEAMACGTPVVTSTGGSLPEVAGDAALLVDPLDVSGLAEAIRRIASDALLAESLRVRGRARAAGFTWERSAQRHLEIYERLAIARR